VARGGGGSSGITALRLERARTVASSLDLRAAVDEALSALEPTWTTLPSPGSTRSIIHGLGTGALRDAVRERAEAARW
jgi:dsDNA-specific endonuclease/ATPase MutS2